jgi:hypothetical protein
VVFSFGALLAQAEALRLQPAANGSVEPFHRVIAAALPLRMARGKGRKLICGVQARAATAQIFRTQRNRSKDYEGASLRKGQSGRPEFMQESSMPVMAQETLCEETLKYLLHTTNFAARRNFINRHFHQLANRENHARLLASLAADYRKIIA